MIFDSHAHYDDAKYQDVDSLILDMKDNGVKKIVNIGSTIKSLDECYKLSNKYDFFYMTSGIHPSCINGIPDNYLDIVKDYASKDKCVAIGEIGLDYYYDFTEKSLQKRVFKEQLQLAKELNLPVVIHCRDAYDETLNILREYDVKAVIHCYSGSKEMVKEFLKLNTYISFTGVVTFKNAKKAVESLKEVPLNRLLIETDSPYMSPEPVRGTLNNSSNITYIAKKYGEILNLTESEVLKLTYDNAMDFFGIDKI